MLDIFPAIKNWFDRYVEEHISDDPIEAAILRLKQDHTHRVCLNAAMLADSLRLDTHDSLLAQFTALLHDVGRFRQYLQYKSFNDTLTENHALLGLREIGRHRLLQRIKTVDRQLICRAIAFHNVAGLPENMDERSLLFMKLIRDADKLDIYKVLIQNYRDQNQGSRTIVLHRLPDLPACSPEILETLMAKKVARFEDMKTLNDFKLLQIGWVYDLNYQASFQTLHRLRYLEQIRDLLPRTKPVVVAVDQALAYVAARI